MREKPILDSYPDARLRVIDPARQDAGYAGKPCCQSAQDIGPPAAMKVHEIWPTFADNLAQPRDQRDIGVAAHRQRDDLGIGLGSASDFAALRTDQEILHAALPEPRKQVQHLLGPAVEMQPGLDMQHPHFDSPRGPPSSPRTVTITSSGVISRRQVKLPWQVGLRRQGEHSSAW